MRHGGKLRRRPQVKWLNDIYIDGRKVAGILIENDLAEIFFPVRSWESGSTSTKPNSIRSLELTSLRSRRGPEAGQGGSF
ncbi:MAG: hypothetical protein ACLUEV_01640 [Alistipes sp.]